MFQVVVADIETLQEADDISDAIVVLLYDRNPDNVTTVSFGDDDLDAMQFDADGGNRGQRKFVSTEH